MPKTDPTELELGAMTLDQLLEQVRSGNEDAKREQQARWELYTKGCGPFGGPLLTPAQVRAKLEPLLSAKCTGSRHHLISKPANDERKASWWSGLIWIVSRETLCRKRSAHRIRTGLEMRLALTDSRSMTARTDLRFDLLIFRQLI